MFKFARGPFEPHTHVYKSSSHHLCSRASHGALLYVPLHLSFSRSRKNKFVVLVMAQFTINLERVI